MGRKRRLRKGMQLLFCFEIVLLYGYYTRATTSTNYCVYIFSSLETHAISHRYDNIDTMHGWNLLQLLLHGLQDTKSCKNHKKVIDRDTVKTNVRYIVYISMVKPYLKSLFVINERKIGIPSLHCNTTSRVPILKTRAWK